MSDRQRNMVYFSKFVMVGLLNTTINYLVYLFCFLILRIHFTVAGVIGFLSGAVTGYTLNRNFTFQSDVPTFSGGTKYLIIQLISLTVHMLVQSTSVSILHVDKVHSQFLGIVVTTFLNFFLSKRYVYAK